MSDGTVPMIARALPGLPSRLRGRLAMTFAAVILITCAVAAALLLSKAWRERELIRERTLGTAMALSFGFDQEVAAGNALLKGLSSSPALKAGDARGFYDQLKATPIPDGSWLILQDLDGQVANTLRPYGAPLPRHRDFPTYPEALNRVRERGWTVSGRMASLVKPGSTIIALSLRIDHDDGTMKGFITTILAQDRLGTILRGQDVPEAWTLGLYDRKLQPIVTARGAETSSRLPMPEALATRLGAVTRSENVGGLIEAVDEQKTPVLVAYRSSGATNWTTVVTVPLSLVDAPVAGALRQMAGMAGILLAASGIAALFTARQVERPLRALADQITGAEKQVSELSSQLLALQEDERQRIARELHDSTAQHLVAANLGLAGLEAEVRHSATGRKILAEIENLQAEALRELRIFTYLLHPPNLANDGLQTTLRDFAEGFAGRTGLLARIRVPEEVDDLPSELQRTILRVVQEALTNVHRHAGASRVSVDARIRSGRLVVRIRDNGHGMANSNRPDGPIRLGVGIAGMRARLEQFGGDLRIKTGPGGTSVVAIVPISLTGRALTQARRMLDPWLPVPERTDGETLH
ncbi:signal transduction histidine kinase [Microvirga lupini]|uniref:Signal transduction histidine kinase n=1 Tax=Microvirga lupini TaxID=420324 RepID=A0A7W4VQM5_9HYPH|nr:histidine kinase [Microvirga lupini]MBB3021528.1 signal transduction histidine kinase [Microvirga lupini]